MDLKPADALLFAPPAPGDHTAAAAIERIQTWWARASRVYPQNTTKAWRCDWKIFVAYCADRGAAPLPATPNTVASFVEGCGRDGKKPATIRRYLSTISRAHKVAGFLNPCDDELVQLEIKGLYAVMSARQGQARGLGWEHIERFIGTAGEGLRAARERAILSVAYDLMARRSELAALDVQDLSFYADGTGRALIRRSKTDQTGEGSSAYLTRDTVRWLKVWLSDAQLIEGAVFRRLTGRGRVGGRLSANAIGEIFKRVATFVGFSSEDTQSVSGHSIRVGAAQDLLALNIDLGSVMQAGRWKSTHMPMRYAEHVLAARGGIGRAAQLQGRDRESPTDQGNVPMSKKSVPTPTPFTLQELEGIITKSGGQGGAREYAAPLLAKIQRLEKRGTYGPLLKPIRTAADQADLRGRLLEVNLAFQFERANVHPEVGATQGGNGDIDFRFAVAPYDVFLETKLLREDDATRAAINAQLAASHIYQIAIEDDRGDIFRLQRDLIQKAKPAKFHTNPEDHWVNLIGVDVSELQLGMADVGDCLLAAGGNPVAAMYCHDSVLRRDVVGVFEERSATLTESQKLWAAEIDKLVTSGVHPREYIHGAVFLFRTPKDTAALVYALSAVVVWNPALADHDMARMVEPVLHKIVSRVRDRS